MPNQIPLPFKDWRDDRIEELENEIEDLLYKIDELENTIDYWTNESIAHEEYCMELRGILSDIKHLAENV